MLFGQPLKQDAYPFRRRKVLPDSRFEDLPISRCMPSAPVAKAEPGRNDDEVLRIFAVTQRLAHDVPGLIEAANPKLTQSFEHAPLLSREHAPFDNNFNRHS